MGRWVLGEGGGGWGVGRLVVGLFCELKLGPQDPNKRFISFFRSFCG